VDGARDDAVAGEAGSLPRGSYVILGEGVLSAQNWAALTPGLLWPLWGATLAAATLAYYYRRRGRCERCGRL
jgi:hypothetical protein